MPIYEYTCPKCGNRFEKLREMKDTTPEKCPKCNHEADRVIASRTSVIGSSHKHTGNCCGNGGSCPSSGTCCPGC